MEDKIKKILESYPTLCHNGFDDRLDHQDKRFDVKRIETIVEYIPYIFTNCSRYNEYSYGMKHQVESLLRERVRCYVSNGEMILAMLCMGYVPKIIRKDGHFKVKYSFSRNIILCKDFSRIYNLSTPTQLVNAIIFMNKFNEI